jgi:very-short-patch-repair endonuclease
MRKTMTDAELKLWNAIRAHRLMGLGFRRQVPIAGYIVDFACPTHNLIVEVDGWQHANDEDFATTPPGRCVSNRMGGRCCGSGTTRC